MTYEASGRPARSIQLDSPFIEEDSLQATLSRSSGSSIVADLSYDLDKFSPSYQSFQFDYSSRTLPRPGFDSLEGLLPHFLYTPPAFLQFTANG